MDQYGRLHMPGFVGQPFGETGVLDDTTAGGSNQPTEQHGNRKDRRREAALDRRKPVEPA